MKDSLSERPGVTPVQQTRRLPDARFDLVTHRSHAAAIRLFDTLKLMQCQDGAVRGPDSGLRLQWRVWRFPYSAFLGPFRPDRNHVYCQTQGYWIRASWLLHDLTGDCRFAASAVACANYLVNSQSQSGGWTYPAAERKHLVSTTEGNWAAVGLVESYHRTGDERYKAAVASWFKFLREDIRFVETSDGVFVNYFDKRERVVPNNTSGALWFVSEFLRILPDSKFEDNRPEMVRFLAGVQLESGEIPYRLPSASESGSQHYLCAQYNAFQSLSLARYYEITADQTVLPILERLGAFLKTTVRPDGSVRYSCHREEPTIPYFAAAVAAALSRLTQLGIIDGRAGTHQIQEYLLATLRKDGTHPFSIRDYGIPFLSDGGHYPRTLAMELYFFTLWALGGAKYQGWTRP